MSTWHGQCYEQFGSVRPAARSLAGAIWWLVQEFLQEKQASIRRTDTGAVVVNESVHQWNEGRFMARDLQILLVEKHANARNAVASALEGARYVVVCAFNGNDALQHVQQHSIDIALVCLGRKRDWNTVQRLTRHKPGLRMLVAGAGSKVFEHALASEADALFEKPLDIPLLVETLRRLALIPSGLSIQDDALEHGSGPTSERNAPHGGSLPVPVPATSCDSIDLHLAATTQNTSTTQVESIL